jgi:hypothetical protein
MNNRKHSPEQKLVNQGVFVSMHSGKFKYYRRDILVVESDSPVYFG